MQVLPPGVRQGRLGPQRPGEVPLLLRRDQDERRGDPVQPREHLQGVHNSLGGAQRPLRRQLSDPDPVPEDRRRGRRRQDEVQGHARGRPDRHHRGHRQERLRHPRRRRRGRLRNGALRSVT